MSGIEREARRDSTQAPTTEENPQRKDLDEKRIHSLGNANVGALLGSGQPLDAGTRAYMEGRIGADLSDVRVHTDAAAASVADAVDARAFTVGSDIVFGRDAYAPEREDGRRLVAHEIIHTIQQRTPPLTSGPLGISAPSDVTEREATRAMRGAPVAAPHASSVHIARQAGASDAGASQQPASVWPPGTSAETYKFQSIEKTAADAQGLLDGDVYSHTAPLVLEQLWIKDMIDVVRIMDRNWHSLEKLTSVVGGHTRVLMAIRAVQDPEHFTYPEGMDIGDYSKDGEQKREMESFRAVRQWPVLLSMAGTPAPTNADSCKPVNEIVDYIRRDRATISARPELVHVPHRGPEVPGGYMYGGGNVGGLRPALEEPDPWRTQVNQAIWGEFAGGEGGASAVNTWDRATLSLGAGFAAGGLLPEVMRRFFASDPAAEGMFLDAGFTFRNGRWLAVDVTTGFVVADDAALQWIRNDVKLLSLFMNIAEDLGHGQSFVNAEWQTIRAAAGNVPDTVRGWPIRTIVYVAHCVHWGGLTWGRWAAIGPDLATIIRTQALHVPRIAPAAWAGGGALQILPIATSTFVSMSGGLARTVLQVPAPLPGDIATGSYGGHIFFDAGNGMFWHLAP